MGMKALPTEVKSKMITSYRRAGTSVQDLPGIHKFYPLTSSIFDNAVSTIIFVDSNRLKCLKSRLVTKTMIRFQRGIATYDVH